jgi:hypothetical protein
LDALQQQGKVFEHRTEVLAYLAMAGYRYSLLMMRKLGYCESHRSLTDSKISKTVLERIQAQDRFLPKTLPTRKPTAQCGLAQLPKLPLSNCLWRASE